MARRFRPQGPPPRPPRARNRRPGNAQTPRPLALRARVGYPPGQPHPCRQYLARQAMGVIEEETTEEEE